MNPPNQESELVSLYRETLGYRDDSDKSASGSTGEDSTANESQGSDACPERWWKKWYDNSVCVEVGQEDTVRWTFWAGGEGPLRMWIHVKGGDLEVVDDSRAYFKTEEGLWNETVVLELDIRALEPGEKGDEISEEYPGNALLGATIQYKHRLTAEEWAQEPESWDRDHGESFLGIDELGYVIKRA